MLEPKADGECLDVTAQCLIPTHPRGQACTSIGHRYYPVEIVSREKIVVELLPACYHHYGVMRAKYGKVKTV